MSFFLFVVWLVMAIAAISIASNKGRNSCGFVFITLLIPIIGLIIAVAMSADQAKTTERAINSGDLVRCEFCQSPIHPAATICPHCRSEVAPHPKQQGFMFRLGKALGGD